MAALSRGLRLPARWIEKVAGYPASADGSVEVILVLKDGRKVFGAILSDGADLVSIDNVPVIKRELDFGFTDIVDVLPGP